MAADGGHDEMEEGNVRRRSECGEEAAYCYLWCVG